MKEKNKVERENAIEIEQAQAKSLEEDKK